MYSIILILGILIGVILVYLTHKIYLILDRHDDRHIAHENEEDRMLHFITSNMHDIKELREYIYEQEEKKYK